MKVICEKSCNKEFVLDVSQFEKVKMTIQEEKPNNTFVETECTVQYFACPHCDYKYIIAVENQETRKQIASIKRIDKKLSRKPITQKEIDLHNKNIKKRQDLKFDLMCYQRELHKLVYLGL